MVAMCCLQPITPWPCGLNSAPRTSTNPNMYCNCCLMPLEIISMYCRANVIRTSPRSVDSLCSRKLAAEKLMQPSTYFIQTQLLLPNGYAPQLRTTPDYVPRHHYAPFPDYLSPVPSPDYAPQHHVTLDSPFSLVLYFQGTPYPMSLSTSSSSSFLAW